MKKQKLLNENNYILFIDSTSINISSDANKNRADQAKTELSDTQKIVDNKFASMLYIFVLSDLAFIS